MEESTELSRIYRVNHGVGRGCMRIVTSIYKDGKSTDYNLAIQENCTLGGLHHLRQMSPEEHFLKK